jgi:transcription initiation factor TFIIIB Brf1 subunit/transcription initiation factor TFIIB
MAAQFTDAVSKDGTRYVNIGEFQNQPGIGLKCNCTCPKCGNVVGARIFRESPESSCFFHEADEKNATCNGGGGETILHLFAKKILEHNTEVYLPHPDNNEAVKFSCNRVKLEKKIGLFRPDIHLTSISNEELIVEITVTHKTISNPEKMKKLVAAGIPAIEITLNRSLLSRLVFSNTAALELTLFSQIYKPSIIDEIGNKEWLVKPNDNISLEARIRKAEKNEDTSAFWIMVALIVIAYFIVRHVIRKRRGKFK